VGLLEREHVKERGTIREGILEKWLIREEAF
jgi:hypothetical protein